MFSFQTLSQQREKQLVKERELDDKLKVCPCSKRVAHHLFQMRELNRVLTLQQIQGHFYNIPALYQTQLDVTNKIHTLLETYNHQDLCAYGLPQIETLVRETITKYTPRTDRTGH